MNKFILVVFAVCLFTGCAVAPVKQVAVNQIIPIQKENSKRIQFKGVIFKVKHAGIIGESQAGYFCVPHGSLYFNKLVAESLRDDFNQIFLEESANAGYNVASPSNSVFEDINPNTEFLISGTVNEFLSNQCQIGLSVKGSNYLKINWEIYSVQEKKIIYSKITEGSSLVEKFETGQPNILTLRAFNAAITNLLSDNGFHDLISKDPGPSQ